MIPHKYLPMRNILLSLTLVLSMGCLKGGDDTQTYTKASWKNESTHTIEIKSYAAGIVQPHHSVQLNPGQEIIIADYMRVGKYSSGLGFSSDYIQGSDSLIVTFDGLYKMSHYIITPVNTAIHFYTNTSRRHLGNNLSYTATETQNDNTTNLVFQYRFIEQDYLDAR
jgi:hypothetical protein